MPHKLRNSNEKNNKNRYKNALTFCKYWKITSPYFRVQKSQKFLIILQLKLYHMLDFIVWLDNSLCVCRKKILFWIGIKEQDISLKWNFYCIDYVMHESNAIAQKKIICIFIYLYIFFQNRNFSMNPSIASYH